MLTADSSGKVLKGRLVRFKRELSLRLKERVFAHYLVPFSRHGLHPALMKWWQPRNPVTVVDVGASHGLFISAVRKHYQLARALLVEPLPKRCDQLREQFSAPEFTVCELALADYNGTAEFNVFDLDYASSLHELPADRLESLIDIDCGRSTKISVMVRKLDELLLENGIHQHIDLLKMDVQGGELNLLKGATISLPRIRNIWCEVAFEEVYQKAATFHDIYDFLASAGFGVRAISDCERGRDGNLVWIDVLFSRGLQNKSL